MGSGTSTKNGQKWTHDPLKNIMTTNPFKNMMTTNSVLVPFPGYLLANKATTIIFIFIMFPGNKLKKKCPLKIDHYKHACTH